ncbi:MAG: hypothetical protein HYT87_19715 [Nitrospirae bacterium]|nr:hypothetical protein [Nitrospirota bacterium]
MLSRGGGGERQDLRRRGRQPGRSCDERSLRASDSVTCSIVTPARSFPRAAWPKSLGTHKRVLSASTVKCWGSNSNGQLGDGTTVNRLTPIQVQNLP